jgi:hypothetical protein
VNTKNSEGFTALDMVDSQGMRNRLCRAGAKSSSSLPKDVESWAVYFRSHVPIKDKLFIRFLRERMLMSNDTHNMMLVVAILLVTVAY